MGAVSAKRRRKHGGVQRSSEPAKVIPILRSAVAVVAGYFATSALVLASDLLAGGVFHAGRDVFTIMNLAVSLPFAVIGGYIAARILRGWELLAGIGLSAFSIVMSLVSLVLDRGAQPAWYWVVLLVLIAAGAFGGAYLRYRQTHRP